jgi:hypothetical protein
MGIKVHCDVARRNGQAPSQSPDSQGGTSPRKKIGLSCFSGESRAESSACILTWPGAGSVPQVNATRFIFCGDALPDGAAGVVDPLSGVAEALEGADVRFINLEGCIRTDSTLSRPRKKKHTLSADPSAVNYLWECGFNIVNIANNHILDLGIEGCLDTVRELGCNALAILGLGEGRRGVPVILEHNGMRIGFLGYADYGFTRMLAPLRRRSVRDVRRLSKRVDFVVVSLHWGFEYTNRPSPRQRRTARSLVDAGARIVVGHHPHVSQGIERYRGAIICYSLGNFLFHVDEMPGCVPAGQRDLQYGFVLKVVADLSGIRGFEPVPVSAYGRGHATVLTGRAETMSLLRLRRLSSQLAASRLGYLPWLWDASGAFALLFRRAWAERTVKHGLFELLHLALEVLQQPILLLLLCVSFVRFPFGDRDRPCE